MEPYYQCIGRDDQILRTFPHRSPRQYYMKPTILLLLTAAFAHAGVILNAPDPNSGFYNGHADSYQDGLEKLGDLSFAQLPASGGLTA
jgi:hypothetical protein